MNYIDPICDLEKRAKAAGISINVLCNHAEVARSTFTRWKNKKSSPTFSVFKKLEDSLDTLCDIPPEPETPRKKGA